MRRSVSGALLAAALAVTPGIAGCGTTADESLTDPREILTRTLRAGSGLRTVTLRAELQIRDPDNRDAGEAGVEGGAVEARIDLVATEFIARGVSATGAEAVRLISVDRMIFTSTDSRRWQQLPVTPEMLANPASLLLSGGGGLLGGEGPDLVGILGQALREPAIPIRLVGVEDCAAGRCYHTAIEASPESLWALAMQLSGMDRMPGFVPAAPPADQLPRIAIAVWSETSRLNPVEILIEGSVGATTIELRVQLANHDEPVSIQPPPPELIDPTRGFGFGDGQGVMVPPAVGGEEAPAP